MSGCCKGLPVQYCDEECSRIGHYSSARCDNCGGYKNNQIEPRFGYTVCEDCQRVSPIKIGNKINKRKTNDR